ncbi:hypothetical protein PLUTO_00960 [Luteibacter phage vB_LflM-Pluto]|uniref:Uncharacterized protein n=1 Tax=Luteibacter phage vB_LflM-Pluto TaxID=2948611 RepID=A0A9E7MUL6_9CAUD|nr:hypothetical protein PLUTO_00960 [Luteibacter phage vB_LflM-Pluto]
MKILYSAKNAGFYSESLHGENIPSDALEISEAEYAAVFAAQSNGATIKAGPDGKPMAVYQTLQQMKDAYCRQIDAAARDKYASTGNESEMAVEYKQALRDAECYAMRDYEGDVPITISCEAMASGILPRDAADKIIATAKRKSDVVARIRAARIIGKSKVNSSTSLESAKYEADKACEEIHGIVK